MIFGSAAISWLVVLFFHAFSSGSFAEVYMLFATSLWLTANFIWMDGRIHTLFLYISMRSDNFNVVCFNKQRGSYLSDGRCCHSENRENDDCKIIFA